MNIKQDNFYLQNTKFTLRMFVLLVNVVNLIFPPSQDFCSN